jgi:hypothetical protein
MHGLIFETSIWLLAGSTRYLPWQCITPLNFNIQQQHVVVVVYFYKVTLAQADHKRSCQLTFKWGTFTFSLFEFNQLSLTTYRIYIHTYILHVSNEPLFWYVLQRTTTLHPKDYSVSTHISWIATSSHFSRWKNKLSVLDFQRCESSAIMLTQTCYSQSCAKPSDKRVFLYMYVCIITTYTLSIMIAY